MRNDRDLKDLKTVSGVWDLKTDEKDESRRPGTVLDCLLRGMTSRLGTTSAVVCGHFRRIAHFFKEGFKKEIQSPSFVARL
jgi:hypothetical protein